MTHADPTPPAPEDMEKLLEEFIARLDAKNCINHSWKWKDDGTEKIGRQKPDVSGRMLAEYVLRREQYLRSLQSRIAVLEGENGRMREVLSCIGRADYLGMNHKEIALHMRESANEALSSLSPKP